MKEFAHKEKRVLSFCKKNVLSHAGVSFLLKECKFARTKGNYLSYNFPSCSVTFVLRATYVGGNFDSFCCSTAESLTGRSSYAKTSFDRNKKAVICWKCNLNAWKNDLEEESNYL